MQTLQAWWDETVAEQEKQIQQARMPASRVDAQTWMEMLKYERAHQGDSPSAIQGDSDLLLQLCIHEEGLTNPGEFTARLRAAMKRQDQPPANDEDATQLAAEWEWLRQESNAAQRCLLQLRRDVAEQDASPPLSPAANPSTTLISERLTSSEIESLKQNQKEAIAYAQKAYFPKAKIAE